MTDTVYQVSHLTLVPRRHYGRIVGAAFVCAVLAAIAHAFAVGQIEWNYVAEFLTVPAIMRGLINTVVMALLAMILGIVLGVIFAVVRLSDNPVLSVTALGYVWLFRAIPALLQLLLWFNLALVFPTISIPGIFVPTVVVMTPFVAALLGWVFSRVALRRKWYVLAFSRDQGQYEAAQTIGMTRLKMLRRIIMPQAMRVIVPPVGNEFIGMVKLTSLASVI